MSGKVDILLGLQWGDEGKGKIVDVLAPKYDIVARFQGGPNAGHTLEFDGRKHVLHQIPSGIFQENTINVIGNGVVLDPITFIKELDSIKQYDLDIKSQLLISNKAQLIIPTHRWLDRAYEKSKGESKIGSTLRGIGPTYQDKMARVGLRIGDILESDFSERYNRLRDRHLDILAHYDAEFDLDKEEKEFFEALDILREFSIINTEYYINKSLQEDKSILAEGAQGSLLDIDFGSYPFVTSSNTISAGACTGLGVSPRKIGEVYGIFKAYCTRVGSGPFPTELHGEEGEALRAKGREFGATTGRPRRCGWLDLPGLNYAVMLNGVTQLFMMKVDVLAEMKSLKVATNYTFKGEKTFEVPPIFNEDWKIEYKDFSSWGDSNFACYDDFPQELADYIEFVEQNINVPVNLVSVGPDRSQTILKES